MVNPFTDADVVDAFGEWTVTTPPVGQGSFKVAYRAEREAAPEVLKILLEPFTTDSEEFDVSEFSERLSRELMAMSATKCPHIVRVTEPAQTRSIGGQNFVWYAEPYYSGGTLEDRLRGGSLPVQDVVALIRALLIAVEDMWTTHAIVHRDIKPGNIVFDTDGTPVLLDLGIALYGNMSDLTSSMEYSPRTPRYAAPEQFEMRKNTQIDFRTDHYLIGMVGYQALTGQHPFWTPGVSANTYLDRISDFSIDRFRGVNCPDELKQVISRMLAPKPNRRYRKIQDPLQELEVLQ